MSILIFHFLPSPPLTPLVSIHLFSTSVSICALWISSSIPFFQIPCISICINMRYLFFLFLIYFTLYDSPSTSLQMPQFHCGCFFIYFILVFGCVAVQGFLQLWCVAFSLWQLLLLQSTGRRHAGFGSCSTWAQQPRHVGSRVSGLQQVRLTDSVVGVHKVSCSTARGIILDQGSNLCP